MSTPAVREYAGPVSRAVAYLLDAFVVAALATAAATAAAMITSVLGARLHDAALALASAGPLRTFWSVVLPVSRN
ncbi:hypothetical protein AB0C29_45230, partial [Actinoplanes sp. NPDC048791]